MPTLNLSINELLTTTRAVRKRLDLTRPVEKEMIEECLSRVAGSRPGYWRVVAIYGYHRCFSALFALPRAGFHTLLATWRYASHSPFCTNPCTIP